MCAPAAVWRLSFLGRAAGSAQTGSEPGVHTGLTNIDAAKEPDKRVLYSVPHLICIILFQITPFYAHTQHQSVHKYAPEFQSVTATAGLGVQPLC